jgi:hypothetical protein
MSQSVAVAAIGLLCPAGVGEEGASGGRPGEVPGFRARAYVENRKNLKLMSRAVKLGVSGIRLALAQVEDWEEIPPERRGMFVGSTPLGGEIGDLSPALEVSADANGKVDLQAFATQGYPLIHPLWLVKGLSNNVLGFASAAHNFQGVNGNYCDGGASGAIALREGWAAIAEGRADLVVAGAADSLVGLEALIPGHKAGEGAAFFVLRPLASAAPGSLVLQRGEGHLEAEEAKLGYLGAAGEVVSLARAAMRGDLPSGLAQHGLSLSLL